MCLCVRVCVCVSILDYTCAWACLNVYINELFILPISFKGTNGKLLLRGVDELRVKSVVATLLLFFTSVCVFARA